MKTKIHKRFSVLLALLLLMGAIPITARAAETGVSSIDELQTAIANAADGDIITLANDLDVLGPITIGSPDKRVTIAGSCDTAAVLHFSEDIPEGSVVKLQNINFAGESTDAGSSEIMLRQDWSGTVQLSDVHFNYCVNSQYKHAYMIMEGTAEFTQCSFEGGRSDSGTHIYAGMDSSVSLDDCTFSAGIASYYGGSIFADGSVSADGCRFNYCHADTSGGAIYSHGPMQITDSTFYGSDAECGGSLYHGGASIEITGCTFENGYASSCGGNLYLECGEVKSSTIVNGTADLDGGGAYCTGTASFSDCTIKSNNSGRSGGGIFACTGVSIDGCKIINNKASTSGADIAAAQVGLSIFDTADEYRSMYSEDLTSGNFSSCSWFSDKELDRYAPDHVTEQFLTPCSNLQSDAYLTFILYGSNSSQDPGDDDDVQTPGEAEGSTGGSPSEGNTGSSSDGGSASTPSESTAQHELTCGDATIDRAAAKECCVVLSRIKPAGAAVSRTDMAGVLYGILTDKSREKPVAGDDAFSDISESAYRVAIDYLAQSGVVCGSEGKYYPDASMTRAQMITMFVRFIDPGEAAGSSTSEHWAAGYVESAISTGWLKAAPSDLDATVTYADLIFFVNSVISA